MSINQRKEVEKKKIDDEHDVNDDDGDDDKCMGIGKWKISFLCHSH